MKKTLILLTATVLVLLLIGTTFWFKISKEAFSRTYSESIELIDFEIAEGEGSTEVGENLQKEKLVKNKNFFYFYVWKTETSNKIQAGTYELAPNMTIPEMVEKFTSGDVKAKILKLTIPEGFTNKKIIEALKKKRPEIASEFKKIATCTCLNQEDCACDKFSDKYYFLKTVPVGFDMEGYLFPDTYFIDEEETGLTLASKFLNNYENKMAGELKEEIKRQGKSTHDVITMASIVEREAKTEEDREIVAGIFWQRLADSFPLQSCATLAYFLGVDKPQFSTEDTEMQSPYNTYQNPGLPPGPISNPGLQSIKATVYPTKTEYYYFLSDLETGEMVYSKTNEEHAKNKLKHGL